MARIEGLPLEWLTSQTDLETFLDLALTICQRLIVIRSGITFLRS